ncbi:MAG TPA: SpoIIE family protein phosphatase [Acidobacteriaceae bacterium]|jgi:hypothetical protein|nr:SpoIIE family protein phosphatase [Acidobacteriaceae bacterium]
MRRIPIVCMLLLPLCVLSQQPLTAPPAAQPAQATGAGVVPVEHIHLGEAIAPLNGPWKFHTGDDPAWSQSSFDDTGWGVMDLSAPTDPSDPSQSGYLAGWTARGYPGYSGFAWYRLTVDVQGATRGLALKLPDSFDDAYQVFVNGVQVGEFGGFHGHHVTAYAALPRAFTLPKDIRNGPLTIAIRMWMDSATPFSSPDAGGLHGPPVLGYASAIAAQVRLDFDDVAHGVGSGFLEMLILIIALFMAGALFWLDPQEKAYLWLALVCVATLAGNSIVLLANFTTPMGQTPGVILSDVVSSPVRIGLWILFWAYWFRLPRMARLQYTVWALVLLLAVATVMLRPPLYGQRIPVEAATFLVPARLWIKLALGVLLFVVAVLGFRRQKAEGGMAAAAILLAFAANFQHELLLIHIPITTSIFGFAISLGTASTILSLLIVTVMLLRRFIYAQRQKEQWKAEIEHARSVQQVLIPDKLPAVEGLQIQSEYWPAREVGGDFFQILPGDTPHTALVAVGDVTGKGLQAGMLVALIVGALRTAVQHTSDPQRILRLINDQLFEREHASATCLILRIEQDGSVDLAGAGHLPPYLNGREMVIEGSLPLGLIQGMQFPSVSFRLKEGDTLTLMSDGIAEAQDSRGRLFGFDRVHRMMREHSTAAEIAQAARTYGQVDDILVLQLMWQGRHAAVGLMPKPQFAAY